MKYEAKHVESDQFQHFESKDFLTKSTTLVVNITLVDLLACSYNNSIVGNMQEAVLDKHIKLVNSPGIVVAAGTTDTHIILGNCPKL